MNPNLKIDLEPREDKNHQIFYLGKLKIPLLLDCSKGMAFLIFVSQEGEEELQIAELDDEAIIVSPHTRKDDRLKVSLKSRTDQFEKKFYICKLQFNGFIDGRNGIDFVIFTAKPGAEELQIVAPGGIGGGSAAHPKANDQRSE